MNTSDKDCRKQINAVFCHVMYLFMCCFFSKTARLFLLFRQIDILGSSGLKKNYLYRSRICEHSLRALILEKDVSDVVLLKTFQEAI